MDYRESRRRDAYVKAPRRESKQYEIADRMLRINCTDPGIYLFILSSMQIIGASGQPAAGGKGGAKPPAALATPACLLLGTSGLCPSAQSRLIFASLSLEQRRNLFSQEPTCPRFIYRHSTLAPLAQGPRRGPLQRARLFRDLLPKDFFGTVSTRAVFVNFLGAKLPLRDRLLL